MCVCECSYILQGTCNNSNVLHSVFTTRTNKADTTAPLQGPEGNLVLVNKEIEHLIPHLSTYGNF